jgi:hypothetical protein
MRVKYGFSLSGEEKRDKYFATECHKKLLPKKEVNE